MLKTPVLPEAKLGFLDSLRAARKGSSYHVEKAFWFFRQTAKTGCSLEQPVF